MALHLQLDVERLHSQLMSAFGIVEQMIDKAVQCLCERQLDLAAEVIATDDRVNQLEVEIEEECLKILALHQPVAADLRRIATVLKINSDLERIADLACNIAERAQNMHEHPYFPIPDQLPEMANVSKSMVKMALDAFVNSDTSLAKQVIVTDKKVDEYNLAVIQELQNLMASDPKLVVAALHCFSGARHIERIADHAENISEDVIYMIDGEIIRHNHSDYLPELS